MVTDVLAQWQTPTDSGLAAMLPTSRGPHPGEQVKMTSSRSTSSHATPRLPTGIGYRWVADNGQRQRQASTTGVSDKRQRANTVRRPGPLWLMPSGACELQAAHPIGADLKAHNAARAVAPKDQGEAILVDREHVRTCGLQLPISLLGMLEN